MSPPSSSDPPQPTGMAVPAREISHRFHIAPWIGLTLLSFYGTLTLPLPFLAAVTGNGSTVPWLLVALGLGAIALVGVLSEQVVLDEQGMEVGYPAWIPQFFRRGWSVTWQEVRELKPRSTGQGGLVYYLLTHSGGAYLLPMRVAGFARLVDQIQQHTGIDTRSVRPLAQPWMYGMLLGCTLLLGLADVWVLWTALTLPPLPSFLSSSGSLL